VVYQYLSTADAATTNGGVVTTLTLIIILYAVLGVATIAILRLLSRRWRQGEMAEEAVPYGPSPAPQDADVDKAGR
jgi:cytochrome bd ubiquinol oxidase subunit I